MSIPQTTITQATPVGAHAGPADSLPLPDSLCDTIAAEVRQLSTARSSRWLLRRCRNGLRSRLQKLHTGILTLIDDQAETFGRPATGLPAATVRVHSPEFYRRVALGGALGFAEAFILGDWTSECPRDVVRVFCRNLDIVDGADRGPVRLLKGLARHWHERRENSRHGSRRNIHAHYDLGNDFYALFLDETMTYSCGIFDSPETSLRDAQLSKIDRICRKLNLQASDHLLEIGTGWGALAIHAARHYGCRVTTTTISREQHEFAAERVAQAGLKDRVTLLLDDYRDLTGTYDKLVSVEMIEAVGYEYFDSFFDRCGRLVTPNGQMVLQGITLDERRYRRYLRSVDFIQRYIFPGGCLITPCTVLQSVARTTDFRLLHIEDLAPHYAQTLNHWATRFRQQVPEVLRRGFPPSFVRLWEFYLAYCEAAFMERHVGTVQIHLARPDCRLDPLTGASS